MSSFQNPVIRGHAPDPSVMRVGDDFYLANSSFRYLPGIPIQHSRDLVHWRTIGFAVSRPAQYRRDGEPGDINLFAPTLRHHDGVFYLICTNQADDQGNFYVTATDPAGPWSDAIWVDREAFDPSLFRDDDGQWYYTRRSLQFGAPDGALGPIVQATIDIKTGELGEPRPITADRRGFASNDIEGPHLFKRDGWYYLFAAEGSSWKSHMQTIGRSRSPWGPFESAPHNPVLSHRDHVAHPFQTIGHADLVDDPRGNWWAVTLGTRHPMFASHHTLGRETFLVPAQWRDGWPYIGDLGHVAIEYEALDLPAEVAAPIADSRVSWENGWRTLGTPDGPATGVDGSVTIAAGADLIDPTPLGTLLLPQSEYHQEFSATVLAAHDVAAGIAVWANSTHHYSALISQGTNGTTAIHFRKVVDDLTVETVQELDGSFESTRLRIEANETSYRFVAEIDGVETAIGEGTARLLSAENIGWFTNVNFALVAVGGPARSATFKDVKRTPRDAAPPQPFGIPR